MKLNHRVGPILSHQSDKMSVRCKGFGDVMSKFSNIVTLTIFYLSWREAQHKMSITCPWVRHIMTLTFQRT